MQNTPQGFIDFIRQGDAISMAIFGLLVLMSVISWSVIVIKILHNRTEKNSSSAYLTQFWQCQQLESTLPITEQYGHSTYARLTRKTLQGYLHHQKVYEKTLHDQGSEEAFITRTLRQALDEITTQRESGMTILATIAATAPFVGLFGTVWGVYHALIRIGATGAGTIDKIAGPVGEALIMTGLGLAVAIPAVIAYNGFTRGNRLLMNRLDGFAFELLSFVQFKQLKSQGD